MPHHTTCILTLMPCCQEQPSRRGMPLLLHRCKDFLTVLIVDTHSNKYLLQHALTSKLLTLKPLISILPPVGCLLTGCAV